MDAQLTFTGEETPAATGRLQERVAFILAEFPGARNNDAELQFRYHQEFDNLATILEPVCRCPKCGYEFRLTLMDRFRKWLERVPSRDTLTRRRREVQNDQLRHRADADVRSERERKSHQGFRW